MNNVVPRMGWFDRSHVDSTIWPSSNLILVTGGLVVPMSCRFIICALQVLALGLMVGCTFAPNLKTFAGENIWSSVATFSDT